MRTSLKRLWKRLQLRVWRRAEDDRDLADEIQFHLAEEERLRDRRRPVGGRGKTLRAARLRQRRARH